METVTLEQVNKNILELRKQFEELKDSLLDLEEKGWDSLAEESLREVWDNEKDDKVWLKYL